MFSSITKSLNEINKSINKSMTCKLIRKTNLTLNDSLNIDSITFIKKTTNDLLHLAHKLIWFGQYL